MIYHNTYQSAMMIFRFAFNMAAVAALVAAGTPRAMADIPRIMTDIAPVQSLVAMVTRDLTTPDLIVAPGAAPHDFALKPSAAAALDAADIVIWVGPELTPWLTDPLAALAGDARRLTLLALPGTQTLGFRAAMTAPHDDDEPDSGIDPHAWLDPENGRVWLTAIAEMLAGADPDNAALYRENAVQAGAEIAALTDEIARLFPAPPARGFMVFHDAYHYFERAVGLEPLGAITLGDAASPGPAHIAALARIAAENTVSCVFAEPDYSQRLIDTVTGASRPEVVVLDPLGGSLPPGPGLYPALIGGMARDMAACLN